jgi:hypothetical protein
MLELAVRGALAGAYDGRAVQVLARPAERTQSERLTGLDARLATAKRPVPDLAGCDHLVQGSRR